MLDADSIASGPQGLQIEAPLGDSSGSPKTQTGAEGAAQNTPETPSAYGNAGKHPKVKTKHSKKKHVEPALPPAASAPECPSGTGSRIALQTTGYDNGVKSTGKKPGDQYYGKTANGETAAHGTVASNGFPRGTVMYIPGYGLGAVSDTGAMKDDSHIDLWFPTEAEANAWGNRKVEVTICVQVVVDVH
jgi:3D (Asp-Asp-Asp) domain-containing protein